MQRAPGIPCALFSWANGFWNWGASRRGIAQLRQVYANAPHSQASSPGLTRLDRAIQYPETAVMESRSRGVLDTPHDSF